MAVSIDINCDLGESFGAWHMGNDAAILPHLSSVNIACGFHAGDPSIMRETVQLARRHKLAIGAHPGYPDLLGFGRRAMQLTGQEVYDAVLYQIGALQAFLHAQGEGLHHVKAHGALYNAAAVNEEYAQAIAQAVLDAGEGIKLYALAGSRQVQIARNVGVKVIEEVFADRTYQDDGSLTPRTESNAYISDSNAAIQQVLSMVNEGSLQSVNGITVPINADTVCIHGDNPKALEFAQALAVALDKAGIARKAP